MRAVHVEYQVARKYIRGVNSARIDALIEKPLVIYADWTGCVA